MIIEHGKGRLYRPDVRDRMFGATRLLTDATDILPKPQSRKLIWHLGSLLDQDGFEECVIYYFQRAMESAPRVHKLDWDVWKKHDYYNKARNRDGFPMPHEGTTARAIYSVAKEEGIIDSYWWIENTEQAIEYVHNYGVLGSGTDWFPSMSTPDKFGYVEPTFDGNYSDVGHQYIISWHYPPNHKVYPDTFVCENSWGPWGKFGNGRFLMKRDTAEYLWWQLNGDLSLAIEKRK